MKRRYTKKYKKRLIKKGGEKGGEKGGVIASVEDAVTRGIEKVFDSSVRISEKGLHAIEEGEEGMAGEIGKVIHLGATGVSQGMLDVTELVSGVTVYTIEGVEGTTNTTFMIAEEGAQVASGIEKFFKKETINTVSGLVNSIQYTLITLKNQSEHAGGLLSDTLTKFTKTIEESFDQGEKITQNTLDNAGVIMKDSVEALETLPGTVVLYPLTVVENVGGGITSVLLCISGAFVIGVTYAGDTVSGTTNTLVKSDKP